MISHHITIFSCTSYVKKVVEMPKELLHCHMNELWVEILQQCRMKLKFVKVMKKNK